jgi:mRNA deadenylase 3'-5' endonuclease subunit Ccr4
LEWKDRKQQIVDQIQNNLHADIVCLQEIDIDLFPDLQMALQPTYQGTIQTTSTTTTASTTTTTDANMTHEQTQAAFATAIFVRDTCPLQIQRVETVSPVAMIAVLTVKDTLTPQTPLYLCNVHLEPDTSFNSARRPRDNNNNKVFDFTKNKDDPRMELLQSVLEHVVQQCQKDNHNNNKNMAAQVPIVLAGDFNMLPIHPFHASLTKGTFGIFQQKHNKDHNNKNSDKDHKMNIQLQDSFQMAETNQREALSLYPVEPKKAAWTYTKPVPKFLKKTFKGGTILDYIWTSDAVRVTNTYLCHSNCMNKGPEEWPSKDYPSDHIPIAIDIDIDNILNVDEQNTERKDNTITNKDTLQEDTSNSDNNNSGGSIQTPTNKIDDVVDRTASPPTPTPIPADSSAKDPKRKYQPQPRTSQAETKLAKKYAAISDVGERAYQILLDLGMIESSTTNN